MVGIDYTFSIWLVVWNVCFSFFFHILGTIIPVTFIFFSGVDHQPAMFSVPSHLHGVSAEVETVLVEVAHFEATVLTVRVRSPVKWWMQQWVIVGLPGDWPGVGKCPFLGILSQSPSNISWKKKNPQYLGDVFNWDIYQPRDWSENENVAISAWVFFPMGMSSDYMVCSWDLVGSWDVIIWDDLICCLFWMMVYNSGYNTNNNGYIWVICWDKWSSGWWLKQPQTCFFLFNSISWDVIWDVIRKPLTKY